jgi:hypothetical protein
VTVRSFNEWYDYHEHFYGKTATVHAGTDDFDVTREELLTLATKFVKNEVFTMQFDLNNYTVKRIEGRPSTPDY